MNITPKKELIIKLCCLFILIVLDLAVYLNGKGLSCNECSINFQSSKTDYVKEGNRDINNFSIKINDLYSNLPNCSVSFDGEGYVYTREIKQVI